MGMHQKRKMHFGILAAGHGSRLANEGASLPKPLIPVGGVPMIERLVRIFERCGAESVSVVINGFMPQVEDFLRSLKMKEGVPLNIKVKTTPSSMHTFYELASMLAGKGRFIATTVDTIFREDNFRDYAEAFRQSPESVDGMMAVTDYIDDEKPLYVETGGNLDILSFRDSAWEEARYVSGGLYGLDSKALTILDDCMRRGVSRMRNYQRALVDAGLGLKAFPMGRIIDVDHVEDIPKAEALLA